MIDNKLFLETRDFIINRQKGMQGIGTLSEKTIHSLLKHYYQSDEDYHEVGVGKYVADICVGNDIIEIQTGNFNKMRDKLQSFLEENTVTIVYPMPRIKYLVWIDKETGECTKRRKSPKFGTPYDAFKELYKIKMFLKNPNLKFKFVMIDIEEYRVLDGWSEDKKKGSHRQERMPLSIEQEIEIDDIRDYMQLVPYDLPVQFSTKDYKKIAKVSSGVASKALNILFYLGIVKKVGKKGNLIIYELNEN